MERLTKRTGAGTAIMKAEYSSDQIYKSAMRQQVIERLAAYEETGLAPEDIPHGFELAAAYSTIRLLKQYEALGTIDDLTALTKARDDGRVVVLDEPCKPLIWGDAEHNSLLCPCCKTDLVGLLYGNRIVLQCPECGQYVDGKTPVATYKAEAALGGVARG